MSSPRTVLGNPNLTLFLPLAQEETVEQIKIIFFGTEVKDNVLRVKLTADKFAVIDSFGEFNLDKGRCTSSKRRCMSSLSRGAVLAA
jgi:hypothetical protein